MYVPSYSTECGGDAVTYVLDVPCCTGNLEQTIDVSQTTQTAPDFWGNYGSRTGCEPPDRFERDPVQGSGFPASNGSGELCPGVWSEKATIQLRMDFTLESRKWFNNLLDPVPVLFANEGVFAQETVGLCNNANIVLTPFNAKHTIVRVSRARHRKPPAVVIPQTATGVGCVLVPVCEARADQFGQPYWILRSIDVVDGGTGYAGGSAQCVIDGELSFPLSALLAVDSAGVIQSAAPGGHPLVVGLSDYAVDRVRTGPPSIQAVAPAHVVGAEFSVSLSHTSTGESQYWSVTSVSAVSAGTGWQAGDVLRFSSPDGVVEVDATTSDVTTHVEPSVTASVSGGTGATLSVTLEAYEDAAAAATFFRVLSVAVSGTTSGYSDQTSVTFSTTGTTASSATARINCVRTEPGVAASVDGSGSGAALTLTLAEGDRFWYVDSLTISDAGTGYTDGDTITFTAGGSDTTGVAASASIAVDRSEPTVSASVSGGSGAALAVTLGSDPEWTVSSVAVTAGGTGYTDGDTVTFSAGSGDVVVVPAAATITTARSAPTLSVTAGGSGTGAVLGCSLSSYTDLDGKTVWYVSGLSITSGGAGYAEGDPLNLAATDGVLLPGFVPGYEWLASVTSVDEDGVITGVAVDAGGAAYKSSGTIESVVVSDGGQYYHTDGSIQSVTLSSGGEYWHATDEIESVTVTYGGAYYAVGLGDITVTEPGRYYQYDYEITDTLLEKPDCTDYSSWEVLHDAQSGPAVGSKYSNQMVVYGRMVFSRVDEVFTNPTNTWRPIRRCAFGTMTVTVQ